MNPISLTEIQQLNTKPFYYSVVKYSQLKNIVKQTSRSNNEKEYQRDLDPNRVSKIQKFIEETANGKNTLMPFPTPIIIATDVTDQEFQSEDEVKEYFNFFENSTIDEKIEKCLVENADFLSKDEQNIYFTEAGKFISEEKKVQYCKLFCKPKPVVYKSKLYFSDQVKKMLIVDGQHRFFGIEEYLKSSNALYEDFEFVVSFLVNYDLYEQAEIFANINFSQKPVNRSLYYDIFGHLPKERSKLKFSHNVIQELSKTESFHNVIKMLGTGPGTISQAFLSNAIEKLLINKKKAFELLYNDYELEITDDNEKYLAKLINILFLAIKAKIPNYFPQHANAKTVFKHFDKIKWQELKTKYPENTSLDNIPESDLSIEELFNINIEELDVNNINPIYKDICDIFEYQYPTYYARDYKYILLKVPGVYSLLKILNDLYNDLNKQHGPGIEFILQDEAKVVQFFQKKLSKVLKEPQLYFESQKSGGGGIQTALYNKIYKAVFDEVRKD